MLRYSIDKATVELLYLPVPAAHTFRVKSFIDTVVYRLGDAAGGLVVLLFAAGAGLVAGADVDRRHRVRRRRGWSAAFVARRQYVENLRESIHQHRVDSERASMPVMDRDTTPLITSRLKGIARRRSPTRSACSRWRTTARCTRRSAGCCITRMPEIRQQAIRLLARAGDATVKDEVEKLVRDPDLGVRTEALLYLTEFDPTDPLRADRGARRLRGLLDPGRAWSRSWRGPGGRRTSMPPSCCCRRWSRSRAKTGRRARLEAARLLAILPDAFDRELRTLLDDEDVEVARAAIAAVGALKKRSMIGELIDRLAEPALNDIGDRPRSRRSAIASSARCATT